jgi:hypothetical protein
LACVEEYAMHFYLNKLAGKNGRVDLVLNHEQILKQKAAAATTTTGSTNQSSHMMTVCDDDVINQGGRGLKTSSNPLENTVECGNFQGEKMMITMMMIIMMMITMMMIIMMMIMATMMIMMMIKMIMIFTYIDYNKNITNCPAYESTRHNRENTNNNR